MKILIVHQYYLSAGQPGGSRFNELARLWAAAGHDVTVIAGNLNYVTGDVPDHLKRRWAVAEADGGVTVWRCHVPSSYRRGYFGRAWGFVGFTLSATTAVLRAARPDVVIATSPPIVTVIPGWIAARFGARRPWVFEIRDLFPESAITTGVLSSRGLLTRLLYAVERWACRSATRINVLTPAFRDDLIARRLARPEKIIFVPNGADITSLAPAPGDNVVRREFGWGERFVATYAGVVGRASAIGQLLDAAEALRHNSDVLIAVVGDGPERARLQLEASTRGLANIQFHGPVAKEHMPTVINASDAGLAVLQNNSTFRTVYPNKVFDYMACARPIVLAIDGVARRLVCEEAEAGVFAEPENGGAIASAILSLANDPARCKHLGDNGRQWVEKNASRDLLARRYLEHLMELQRAR